MSAPLCPDVLEHVLERLPAFLRELLSSCPPAGRGVHQWLFRTARHLFAHFEEPTIYQLLRAGSAHCGRKVTDREILDQIKGALPRQWKPTYPQLYERYGYRIKSPQSGGPQ